MGPRKKNVDGPPSLAERIKASNNSPLEQSERVPRLFDLHKEVRKFVRLYCREVAIQPSILRSIKEARSTNQCIMTLYNKESNTRDELEKHSVVISSNIGGNISTDKNIDDIYNSDKEIYDNNHTRVKSTRRLNHSNYDGKTLAEMVNTTRSYMENCPIKETVSGVSSSDDHCKSSDKCVVSHHLESFKDSKTIVEDLSIGVDIHKQANNIVVSEIPSNQANMSDGIVRKKYTDDNLDVLNNITGNIDPITVENTNDSSNDLLVHMERHNELSPEKCVRNVEYGKNAHGDTKNILSNESQQTLINTHNSNSPNCNNKRTRSDSCDKISLDANQSLLDTSEKTIYAGENSDDSRNNTTVNSKIIGCRRPRIPRYRALDKQCVVQCPIPPDGNSLDVRSSFSLSSSAAILPLSKTGETHTPRTDDTTPSKRSTLECQKTEANARNHKMYANTLHDTLNDKQDWNPPISILTSYQKKERVPAHRHYEITALSERYFSDTHLTKNGKQNCQRQKYYAFGSTIIKSGQSQKIHSSRKRLSQLIGGQSRNKLIQNQLKKFGDTEFSRSGDEHESVESEVNVPRYMRTTLNRCFPDEKPGFTVQSDPYHEYPQTLSWFVKSGVVEVDERYTFEEKKQTKSKAYRMIQQQHSNRISSETLPSINPNYNIISSVKSSRPKRVRFKRNPRTKPIAKQTTFISVV